MDGTNEGLTAGILRFLNRHEKKVRELSEEIEALNLKGSYVNTNRTEKVEKNNSKTIKNTK